MAASTMGQRIQQARTEQGYTIRQLATRIAVKPATVENWEKDRSEPRSNKMLMLSGILGVPLLWLLDGASHTAPFGAEAPPETAAIARKLERAVALHQDLASLLIEVSADVSRLQRGLDTEGDDIAA